MFLTHRERICFCSLWHILRWTFLLFTYTFLWNVQRWPSWGSRIVSNVTECFCFILFCPLQHTHIVYPPACWLSLLQLSNLISSPIGLQKWIKHLFIQHVCAFDWCFALFVLSQSCAHFVINWALFGRHFALFNSLKGKILLFRSAALRVINYDSNKRCLCCASKTLPVQGIFLC